MTGTGYVDTWSETQNVPLEGSGSRQRQFLAHRLGGSTSSSPRRTTMGRGKSIVAFRRSDGKAALGGIRAERAGRVQQPKNGHASGTPSTDGKRVLCLPGQSRADRRGFQGQGRLAPQPRCARRRITAPPARPCSTRIASSSTRIIAAARAPSSRRSIRQPARTSGARRGSEQVGWGTPIAIRAGDARRGHRQQHARVYAYDPDSGTELWSAAGNLFEVIPTPVVGEGMVFCSSGRAGPTLAIRPGGSGT